MDSTAQHTNVDLFPFRFEEPRKRGQGHRLVVMASNLTLARGYIRKKVGLDMEYVGAGLPDSGAWDYATHK